MESTQDLVTALKTADARQLAAVRRAKRFFAIATALFCFAFIVTFLAPNSSREVRGEILLQRATLACIYIIVSAVYVLTTKKLARVDYAVPLNQFLEEAERRYRFMSPQDWVLSLVGLVVVGAVATIGYAPYLSRIFGLGENTMPMYLLFPAFIIAVAVMGFSFTWKNWKRDRSPLWEQIVRMRNELKQS